MWSKSFGFSHVSVLKYNVMFEHMTSAPGGSISTLIVKPYFQSGDKNLNHLNMWGFRVDAFSFFMGRNET